MDSDADDVVSLAKEEGFSISVDDLKNAQSELSDEELENAAGGRQPGYAEELSKAMGGGMLAFLDYMLSLLIKAPATAGVFYCFNHPKKTINQPSIPGTIARI